jgi:predicted anti-sigma-YlaC factor YlaD
VVTVTVAEADLLVSACEMAVTVTVAGFGTAVGAVYRPAVEIVPTVLLPPATPFTCHVTAVLLVF